MYHRTQMALNGRARHWQATLSICCRHGSALTSASKACERMTMAAVLKDGKQHFADSLDNAEQGESQ